jgi:hypothetical protein
METLIQNLRYAARQVRRAPGYAAVVVVTIAVGVGVTTTIFSLVNAVLLRPLPVEEPDRLVGLVEVLEQGSRPYVQTYPNFRRLREAAPPVLLRPLPADEVPGAPEVVHAGALVGLGLAAGLFLALATTRALSALLMGISPTDPLTFAAVVLLLAMTGLLAAWGPARRAMRVDPMTTLKSD